MLVPGAKVSAGELAFFRDGKVWRLDGAASNRFEDVSVDLLLPLVKDEVRLQFMRSRPDLLWMHAGAVERDGGALLVSGRSGQGKSTMTTWLVEHGWRYMTDDVAPVRMETDRIIPFLQAPVRRLHPGREVEEHELSTLKREAPDLNESQICRLETEIRGIVFVAYTPGADATLRKLDMGAAALELLRNATNFVDHKAAAVGRAANLAERVPMHELVYSNPGSAADLLRDLW